MTTELKDVRLDSSFEVERMSKTEDGFLDIWGVSATVGVLEYTNPDGSVRKELATDETLESSNESLKDAPVVVEHPPGGHVGPDNAKQLQVGHVADVSVTDGEQRVRLRITDADAIAKILSGEKPELSPGYIVAVEVAPDDEAYDLVQVARRVNHLALTGAGRGETKLRLDSQYVGNYSKTEPNMATKNPDEPAENIPDERFDSIEATLKKINSRLDAVEDTLTKPDPEPTEPATEPEPTEPRTDSKPFAERFKEHKEALDVAERLNLDSVDADADTLDVKRACVQDLLGDKYRTDSSDERIEASFDVLVAQLEKDDEESPSDFETEFANGRLDSTRQDSDDEWEDPSAAWIKSVSGNQETK